MHKKRAKSEAFIAKSEIRVSPVETNIGPFDTLIVKIISLRVSGEDPRHFAIKVTFFDQLLIHAIIRSIGARDEEQYYSIAHGSMTYDPSDYEKMCLFADNPLVVHIQPLRSIDRDLSNSNLNNATNSFNKRPSDISCCNVDILAIFLGEEDKHKICVKKRMEPMVQPSVRRRKSWDTLPLLTMELTAERDPLNTEHHKVLKDANWMKLTLVAAYNMFIPFENDYVYTAASKTTLYGDSKVGLVTFSQGYREPRRFDCTNFFPKWESLRAGGELFTRADQKLHCNIEDIQNYDNIDLPYYLNRILPYHTSVWGSFHRTLMLKNTDQWLWKRIRSYKWPLEFHIYGETGGYSFMAFLNFFQLLYPGVQTVRLAVPLQWVNAVAMAKNCGCEPLLTPNDRPPSVMNERLPGPAPTAPKASKSSKFTTDSNATSASTFTTGQWKATGADDNDAFVLVEVRLGRPLKPIFVPPRILKDEISTMLTELEKEAPRKRLCYGRGQLERDWHKTVRRAVTSLRKVPYYGATEFCTFNRQLSETRTRVELTTSCWQDATIYMNNNFIIQQYLHSDEVFEELVMMAHACLIKSASNMLLGNVSQEIEPGVRAARHARQMQDTHHAMELYLRLVVEQPRYADHWRELSTCLKDIDRDWAITCLNKSVVLNPRHPLTLLSKGAMLFEENPTAAEPFFMGLLTFNPAWVTAWAIASVYFFERELFHVADVIMEYANKNRDERYPDYANFSCAWERELGDWWDSTPLLPNMSLYFDAADLLLRLRAIPLAEACMARELTENGESAAYYHMVALCWRLRGDFQQALCHLKIGQQKFGDGSDLSYMKSLEAECQHTLGDIANSTESYQKAEELVTSFSILMALGATEQHRVRSILVDLVRRQPSAHAWAALAEDWITRANISDVKDGEHSKHPGARETHDQMMARSSAIACTIQALKLDRRAGRAWAMLAKLVKPSARRLHCYRMANMCGWEVSGEDIKRAGLSTNRSFCHQVGTAIRECRCHLCEQIRI